MLINSKANVKATGQKGETPLHLVCASVKIIELLHQNGADMNSKVKPFPYYASANESPPNLEQRGW